MAETNEGGFGPQDLIVQGKDGAGNYVFQHPDGPTFRLDRATIDQHVPELGAHVDAFEKGVESGKQRTRYPEGTLGAAVEDWWKKPGLVDNSPTAMMLRASQGETPYVQTPAQPASAPPSALASAPAPVVSSPSVTSGAPPTVQPPITTTPRAPVTPTTSGAPSVPAPSGPNPEKLLMQSAAEGKKAAALQNQNEAPINEADAGAKQALTDQQTRYRDFIQQHQDAATQKLEDLNQQIRDQANRSPGAWFDDKSMGGKVLFGVGTLLSALGGMKGGHLLGGIDGAVGFVNDQAKQDVQAQAERAKQLDAAASSQGNLVQTYRNNGLSYDQAIAAAEAQQEQLHASQIRAAATRVNDQGQSVAMLQAAQKIDNDSATKLGVIREQVAAAAKSRAEASLTPFQKANLMAEANLKNVEAGQKAGAAADVRSVLGKIQTNQDLSPEDEMLLTTHPELSKHYVPGVKGITSEANAAEANKYLAKTDPLIGMIDQNITFRNKNGVTVPLTAENAKGKVLGRELQMQILGDSEARARLSPQALKVVQSVAPDDPGSLGRVLPQLQELRRITVKERKDKLKALGLKGKLAQPPVAFEESPGQ